MKDDSYKDLLNVYTKKANEINEDDERAFSPIIRKRSKEKSDSVSSGFKVNIKNIDDNFGKTSNTRVVQPKRETVSRSKKALESDVKIYKPGAIRTADSQNRAVVYKKNGTTVRRKGKSKSFIISSMSFSQLIKNHKKGFSFFAICITISIVLSIFTISCMNDVLAIGRKADKTVEVNVPANMNTRTAIKLLSKKKLIKHRLFCTAYAKVRKIKDGNYMTGIYYLNKSMGVEKMLYTIKQPPKSGETVTITFPEGFTIDQIVQKLAANGVCDANSLYAAINDVDFSNEYAFLKGINNRADRYRVLEGFFYPDTYEFFKEENASAVVRVFLSNFKNKWTADMQKQADALGLTADQAVRLASIIQKEAGDKGQMNAISGVLVNRLKNQGLYPTLQCDSTTHYIEDFIKTNLTDKTKIDKFVNAYSTYKCEGLPAGAIGNPGIDALKAAVNPDKSNYFFFAHDVNGKIYLASTDAQRQSNAIEILRVNKAAEKNKNNE